MQLELAHQLCRLGTETAFAVSALAAEWQAKGNRVYPFHLGDINLMPPQALIDGVSAAIKSGKNGYCPGAGIPLLREQLAAQFAAQRGVPCEAENIAVQPGGKPVIAKFLQAVMNPGEEVLYPAPGFPIYESQIRYQGGIAVPYHYHPLPDGAGFTLDLPIIDSLVGDSTRAIIVNNYHNPTGSAASAAELDAIAEIAVANDLAVLNDDAYYLIRYDDAPPQSLLTRPGMMERTVTLFTFSKQFAMTGWRLGAAIAPAHVTDAIAALNTNMESCTPHFIQHAVAEALAAGSADHTPIVAELKKRRDALTAALNSIDGIRTAPPPSAFYIYCDLQAIMQRKGCDSIETLMHKTLQHTGVSFCTGAHFGIEPTTTHARFAFSGISVEDIAEAGAKLKAYFEAD